MSESIFIYSPNPLNGSRDLAAKLGGIYLRNFDGMHFWQKGKRLELPTGSAIINWGGSVPDMDGVRVLNGATSFSPRDQISMLSNMVPIATTYWSRPFRLSSPEDARSFCARKFNHFGANDLINPPKVPDYWQTKIKDGTEEIVLHSFDGRSILAGKKVPKVGHVLAETHEEWEAKHVGGVLVAHPWIKSETTGWTTTAEGFKSTPDQRKMAKAALAALDMSFGNVTIITGRYASYVMGVHSLPKPTSPTLDLYANAIKRWLGKATEQLMTDTEAEELKEEVLAEIRPAIAMADIPIEVVGPQNIEVPFQWAVQRHPWIVEEASIIRQPQPRVTLRPRDLVATPQAIEESRQIIEEARRERAVRAVRVQQAYRQALIPTPTPE